MTKQVLPRRGTHPICPVGGHCLLLRAPPWGRRSQMMLSTRSRNRRLLISCAASMSAPPSVLHLVGRGRPGLLECAISHRNAWCPLLSWRRWLGSRIWTCHLGSRLRPGWASTMRGSLDQIPWPLPMGVPRGKTQTSLQPRPGPRLISHLLQTRRCPSTPASSTTGGDSPEITPTTKPMSPRRGTHLFCRAGDYCLLLRAPSRLDAPR